MLLFQLHIASDKRFAWGGCAVCVFVMEKGRKKNAKIEKNEKRKEQKRTEGKN